MLINPIAREIVIDGDDGVEHTASPFFGSMWFVVGKKIVNKYIF
jgi:hypothetical protein